MQRLVLIGAIAGALAAASVPLTIAIVIAVGPELSLLTASAFALIGSRAGAEVGAWAAT